MSQLVDALSRILPAKQVITDSLRRLAYGTDASFYRLTPEVVAVVESEAELQALLQAARAHQRPVTFRAAGTSLSGQAVTDSVLALIGEGFATCEIGPEAATVRVGPGIIGGEVNFRLAPTARKLAPTRHPSTPARSAALPPTTLRACAAVPPKTATARWSACG